MAMKTTRPRLDAARSQLLSKLATIGPFIQGSVVATARICGKKGCACHHGGPKHPVMYVTWKEGNKTVSLYVPRAFEKEVRTWARNYKKLRDILTKLSNIQKSILRLRDD
jgi:hypothetical protein